MSDGVGPDVREGKGSLAYFRRVCVSEGKSA